MFIVFEGIDGCGKTTQVKMLMERLQSLGSAPVLAKHVGAGNVGMKLRDVLYNTEPRAGSMAEILLYAADLAEQTEKFILPALAEDKPVIADRYWYSSYAYQGFGDGYSPSFVEEISRKACHDVQPDHVIWLDLNPVVCMERLKAKPGGQADFYEKDPAIQYRIRNGHVALNSRIPQYRRLSLSSMMTADDVFQEVLKAIGW